MFDTCLRTGFVIGVAVTALTGTVPAWAQDAAGASDTGDIIVTARRVEERLQDVPISISVFNQAQLDNQNITSTSDLAQITPSLSVNPVYGPDKATFSIRGFTEAQSTAPTVGVYFADVVGVRAEGGTSSGNNVSPGAFMDLQSVQVLDGPQGTLFGKNTTGGAVLLVPNRPTDRLGGWVEGTLGDYGERRIEAVLNIPLSDTFKVRFAADRNLRDGYIHNISGIGPADYNNVNYEAYRMGILGDLTPNLENYTLFQYGKSHDHGYAYHVAGCNPAFAANPANGLAGVVAGLTCAQIARDQTNGGAGPLTADVDEPNPSEIIEQWQVINTTTWHATDQLTVKNIASYGEFKEYAAFNLYSLNLQVPGTNTPFFQYVALDRHPGEPAAGESTVTEELQLQGDSLGGRLKWVAGSYLEFSRPLGWNEQNTGIYGNCTSAANLQCAAPLGFAIISDSRTQVSFNDEGLFTQGTFKITDRLAVTAGARYTWDSIYGVNESTDYLNFGGGFVQTCTDSVRLLPDAIPNAFGKFVTNAQQCREYTGQPASPVFAGGTDPLATQPKSSKPTWLIDLEYKPDSDVLMFAKWARGYRQGGLNFTGVGQETWQPERIDDYEIGAKTGFHGAISGTFDITGFYDNLYNQQINAGLLSLGATNSGAGTIVNAGQAVSKGVEVSASLDVHRSLSLFLGYTHNIAKVTSMPGLQIIQGNLAFAPPPGSPYSAVVPDATPGQIEANTPKNRVTLTANYTVPFPESYGKLTLGATLIHTDSQQTGNPSFGTPIAYLILPATNILNLDVNWARAMGGPADLAFFMTNATNEIYPVSATGSWQAAGFGALQYAPPRMFGFRVKVHFGG